MVSAITQAPAGGRLAHPWLRPFDVSCHLGLALPGLVFLLLGQFAVLHALQLDSIGIEEEHGVVVLVILVGRIDDPHLLLFEEGLQRIDVAAAAQLEGVMMQADIADLVFLPSLGRGDPVAGLAVGPADRLRILVGDLEAQELEELRVEGLGLLVIADPDRDVVNADDLRNGHGFLLAGNWTTCGNSLSSSRCVFPFSTSRSPSPAARTTNRSATPSPWRAIARRSATSGSGCRSTTITPPSSARRRRSSWPRLPPPPSGFASAAPASCCRTMRRSK